MEFTYIFELRLIKLNAVDSIFFSCFLFWLSVGVRYDK